MGANRTKAVPGALGLYTCPGSARALGELAARHGLVGNPLCGLEP